MQHIAGLNRKIKSETLTWDGVLKTQDVLVDGVDYSKVLIRVDSTDQAQDLVVTFYHKTGDDAYGQWCAAAGTAVTFTALKNVNQIYGPFEGFPRFLGGKLTFTASTEPADTKTTIVEVVEI